MITNCEAYPFLLVRLDIEYWILNCGYAALGIFGDLRVRVGVRVSAQVRVETPTIVHSMIIHDNLQDVVRTKATSSHTDTENPIDWDARISNWQAAINNLYNLVQSWLKPLEDDEKL